MHRIDLLKQQNSSDVATLKYRSCEFVVLNYLTRQFLPLPTIILNIAGKLLRQ